ncbi:hypothetical protein RHBI111906_09340 [Rhodothermus bifroesti]|nr:hypothetical protein HRbin18_00905 [bacterium HR18]
MPAGFFYVLFVRRKLYIGPVLQTFRTREDA